MINYKGQECTLRKSKYQEGGSTALYLVDSQTGEPVVMATVNMPEISLGENEVLIKDYSENKGILKTLIDARILEDTGKRVPAGYTEVAICKLKDD